MDFSSDVYTKHFNERKFSIKNILNKMPQDLYNNKILIAIFILKKLTFSHWD